MSRNISHKDIDSGSFELNRKLPQKNRELAQKPIQKAWYWLFLLPFLGLLWPAWYAKTDPVLFGFPFFYWYQFAWVIISVVLTGIVYLTTRRR